MMGSITIDSENIIRSFKPDLLIRRMWNEILVLMDELMEKFSVTPEDIISEDDSETRLVLVTEASSLSIKLAYIASWLLQESYCDTENFDQSNIQYAFSQDEIENLLRTDVDQVYELLPEEPRQVAEKIDRFCERVCRLNLILHMKDSEDDLKFNDENSSVDHITQSSLVSEKNSVTPPQKGKFCKPVLVYDSENAR
jgi:protein associated with RNAse G/E